jgi:hypothetical protein
VYKGKNKKLDDYFKTLMQHRFRVCAFHTKQIFNFGKSSSQLSECWHSQIKGGNEFSRFLRAQSFIETIVHIATSMKIYLDETIAKIRKCVDAKHEVSDWIGAKIDASVKRINRCLCPVPRLNGTENGYELWLLFESVPLRDYLPAFVQKHEVRFKELSVCECRCPYFVSTKLPCSAVCAVLAQKGYATIPQLSQFLHGMWLVRNHPLFEHATKPQEQASQIIEPPLPPIQSVADDAGNICRMNADAMRALEVPTDPPGRRQYLSSLWEQIITGTIASAPASRSLAAFLLQHRATLSRSQVLMVPPARAITSAQDRSGKGPAADVANKAAKPAYNRSAKKRVADARSKDPACYSVCRTGIPGQMVKCLCGVEHVNDKRVSHLFLLLHVPFIRDTARGGTSS